MAPPRGKAPALTRPRTAPAKFDSPDSISSFAKKVQSWTEPSKSSSSTLVFTHLISRLVRAPEFLLLVTIFMVYRSATNYCKEREKHGSRNEALVSSGDSSRRRRHVVARSFDEPHGERQRRLGGLNEEHGNDALSDG